VSAAPPSTRVDVRKDNPLCGDTIDLTVELVDGRIGSAASLARACSLVKDSAALLEAVAPGRTPDEARAVVACIDRAVRGRDTWPVGFERLEPVLLMPSRRGCVLLPWQALRDALEMAR
jgi:nitrogen fixation NifU-like protein